MLDRRLEYVVAVSNAGSFTSAAEKVGVTQSGVTRAIADLERELGYALFHRTARGAVPTEDGREFLERARRLLDDARILLSGEREKDPYARLLRIGVCPASLEWLLAEPLADLLARHPGIRFDVVAGSFERTIQLLRSGSLDVAIGFDDAFAEWIDIRREQLAYLEAVPFVRLGHPILQRPSVQRSELVGFDFVVPSDSRPYAMIIRSLFEEEGLSWQKHLHLIDYFPTVRRLVRMFDLIGVTTQEYSKTHRFLAEFAKVPGDTIFPPTPLCCATRSRWEVTPPTRAFLSVMKQLYRKG